MVEFKVGERVVIVGKHPWKGHVGRVFAEPTTPAGLSVSLYTIRLESGHSCMAKPENLTRMKGTAP